MQIRQGDVFLEKIASIPKDAQQVNSEDGKLILARGEATGHHHSVAARDAMLFLVGTVMYLRCLKETQLRHQEHEVIPLKPGDYRVTRQVEYHPKEIRRVED